MRFVLSARGSCLNYFMDFPLSSTDGSDFTVCTL
uniref:Uncharacterized protein n=1 Tax=Anguilla anguilla TaxID=7936 RepID=A0A0E9SK39_ANGAN